MKDKIMHILDIARIPFTERERYLAVAEGYDIPGSVVAALHVSGVEKISTQISVSGLPYLTIHHD